MNTLESRIAAGNIVVDGHEYVPMRAFMQIARQGIVLALFAFGTGVTLTCAMVAMSR